MNRKVFQEELERCKNNHKSKWEAWISKDDDNSSSKDGSPKHGQISGNYNVKFIDNLKLTKAKMRIEFHREDNRYRISGVSMYKRIGEARIVEGFVLLDGSEGWWREEVQHSDKNDDGNVAMELINYGTFDFERKRFRGTWRTSTGNFGSFIEFSRELL